MRHKASQLGWRYAAVIPSTPIWVASVRYTGMGLSLPVYRNPLKGQNSLSLSLCLTTHTHTHTHAHACTCTHTHAHTHAHTHTHIMHTLPPSPPPPPTPPPPPLGRIFFPPSTYTSPRLCLSLLPICPWQRNKEPSKPGVQVKLLTVAIDIRERERANHCNIVYSGIPVQNTGSGVKYR